MKLSSQLLRLNADSVGEPEQAIAADRVLAGNPQEVVANLFTNTQENFFCGVWASTTGQWTLNYTEDEFCYMIEGTAILRDALGNEEALSAGDAFVIPAGYEGSWETIGSAKKFYAIYEQS